MVLEGLSKLFIYLYPKENDPKYRHGKFGKLVCSWFWLNFLLNLVSSVTLIVFVYGQANYWKFQLLINFSSFICSAMLKLNVAWLQMITKVRYCILHGVILVPFLCVGCLDIIQICVLWHSPLTNFWYSKFTKWYILL